MGKESRYSLLLAEIYWVRISSFKNKIKINVQIIKWTLAKDRKSGTQSNNITFEKGCAIKNGS